MLHDDLVIPQFGIDFDSACESQRPCLVGDQPPNWVIDPTYALLGSSRVEWGYDLTNPFKHALNFQASHMATGFGWWWWWWWWYYMTWQQLYKQSIYHQQVLINLLIRRWHGAVGDLWARCGSHFRPIYSQNVGRTGTYRSSVDGLCLYMWYVYGCWLVKWLVRSLCEELAKCRSRFHTRTFHRGW